MLLDKWQYWKPPFKLWKEFKHQGKLFICRLNGRKLPKKYAMTHPNNLPSRVTWRAIPGSCRACSHIMCQDNPYTQFRP